MLTKNYYAFLTTALMGYGASGAVAVDASGTTRTLYTNQCSYAGIVSCNPVSGAMLLPYDDATYLDAYIGSYTSTGGNYYPPVRFGSGTTPATVDDYKLESAYVSGLTIISTTSIKQSLKDNVITREYSYILKNTTSTDKVIGEIGLFYQSYYGSTSTSAKFLVERTVLDEPVTIAPGGTGTVVYTLTIKCPTCPTE